MTTWNTPRRLTFVRDQLLIEHRRLDALYEQLMDAFAANSREDTQTGWTELSLALEAHFDVEERHLFPPYSEVNPDEVKGLQAEHRRLGGLLAELGVGVDLKLVRHGVAKAFIASLRAHALREERLLYRWVDSEAAAPERHSAFDVLAHH